MLSGSLFRIVFRLFLIIFVWINMDKFKSSFNTEKGVLKILRRGGGAEI